MKTGDYLHNDAAQQHYICTNYSFAARDMLQQGINVLAQAVAAGDDGALSLSSNPDVTAELAERMAAAGKPLLKIACVNGEMPFMLGDAVVLPSFFDIVVTDPAGTHTLFAPPNARSAPWTTPSACMPAAWCAMAARCRSASARWATRSRMR